MPRGGARNGAGRPPGSKNAPTLRREETRAIAALTGRTPLEVMLQAMTEALDAGDTGKAAGYAKDAAPYIHSKAPAVVHAEVEKKVTHVVEFVVSNRSEADKVLATLTDSGGLPRL